MAGNDNSNDGPVNSTKLNQINCVQIDRINKLLLETWKECPTVNELNDQCITANNLSIDQRNTIYSILIPFETQKSKLFQCIERLDTIMAITKSQKLNLFTKLDKIEETEKQILYDILFGNKRNQKFNSSNAKTFNKNINLTGKTKSKNIKSQNKKNAFTDKVPTNRSRSANSLKHQNKLKIRIHHKINRFNYSEKLSIDKKKLPNIVISYPLNRKETLNPAPINSFLVTKGLVTRKSTEIDENSTFNDGDLPKLSNKRKLINFQNDLMKMNNLISENYTNLLASNVIPNTVKNKEPKHCEFEKTIPEKTKELEVEKKLPRKVSIFNEIKNKKYQNVKPQTKYMSLENRKFENTIKFQPSTYLDDDLLKTILAKFDSVKQFIDEYNNNHKNDIQINKPITEQENYTCIKEQYVNEWIISNKDPKSPTNGIQFCSNNKFRRSLTSSIANSLRNYGRSTCISIEDKGCQTENIWTRIDICENQKLNESDKQVYGNLGKKV